MIGSVTISGKEVPLKATASTLRKYRARFNRDLIKDFKEVEKAFTSDGSISGEIFVIVEDLTYIMAKQADKSITDNIDDWLDQFDTFPISEFAVDVIMLWANSLEANVESKNV